MPFATALSVLLAASGPIASLSSEQQMRRAVCEVLARVPRPDRPAPDGASSAPDPGAGRPRD